MIAIHLQHPERALYLQRHDAGVLECITSAGSRPSHGAKFFINYWYNYDPLYMPEHLLMHAFIARKMPFVSSWV